MNKHLLIAILSTIAMALSAGSAIIAPDPLSLLAFGLFTIACTLNWTAIVKKNEGR